MKSAQLHPNEQERINRLLKYEVLDTDFEKVFDELTELASIICETPISLISLVDDKRQWFKSKVGLEAQETSKEVAFCSHAILQEKVFEINNALDDERFYDNPLVTEHPSIRFYAGAPLVVDDLPIGTLCVIDSKPKALSANQKKALSVLANQVISQLEVRLMNLKLKRINDIRDKLFATIAHDLRSPFNSIINLSNLLQAKAERLTQEKISTMAKDIFTSSMNLYQLLDELLQWAQNQIGSTKIKQQDLALRSLFEETVDLYKEVSRAKKIQVINQIPDAIKVKGDAVFLKNIMRNLVANAIKFSPEEGEVVLSSHGEAGWVTVAVIDNGDGIPEDMAKKVFSQSVESCIGTGCEQGAGLGLFLCQTFITLLGGTIRVDKNHTQGTRIEFLLPQA